MICCLLGIFESIILVNMVSIADMIKRFESADAPNDIDVLLGKTKQCFNHVGNQLFRKKIYHSVPDFQSIENGTIAVRKQFFEDFTSKNLKGSRFLKLDSSSKWRIIPMHHKIVREKVAHALRDTMKYNYGAQSKKIVKKAKAQKGAKKPKRKYKQRKPRHGSPPPTRKTSRIRKPRLLDPESEEEEEQEEEIIEEEEEQSDEESPIEEQQEIPAVSPEHDLVLKRKTENEPKDDNSASKRRKTRQSNAFGPSTTRSTKPQRITKGRAIKSSPKEVTPQQKRGTAVTKKSKPKGKLALPGRRSSISQRQKVKPEAFFVVQKSKPKDLPKEYVDEPTGTDVLLDGRIIDHQGNRLLDFKIQEAIPGYRANDEKDFQAEFIENFIGMLVDSGVRFLKIDPEMKRWYIVPFAPQDRQVRSRVRSEFRGTRPPTKSDVIGGAEIRKFDILMGKTAQCFNHAGNMAFREKVAYASREFLEIDGKKPKVQFIDGFIDSLVDEGTRFLKLDYPTKTWRIIPSHHKIVREKCSHALREPVYDRYNKNIIKKQITEPSQTPIEPSKKSKTKKGKKDNQQSELAAAQILVCLESMVSDNSTGTSNGDEDFEEDDEAQLKDLECNENLFPDDDSFADEEED